jgi:hypothetical protein
MLTPVNAATVRENERRDVFAHGFTGHAEKTAHSSESRRGRGGAFSIPERVRETP